MKVASPTQQSTRSKTRDKPSPTQQSAKSKTKDNPSSTPDSAKSKPKEKDNAVEKKDKDVEKRDKDVEKQGKHVETMDINTVGSDMLGKEPKLRLTEKLNLTLDRECTPMLYMYFAGIAILAVITAGIVVIVGLQCNWNFLAD